MANILAIVGRPNVGKSTLFNKLVGERRAIMDNVSGVTRDRHYGQADWGKKNFTVIDTGGYVNGSDDIFEEEIRKQVTLAIDEATVVLFMVDVDSGVVPLDEEFANVLRRTKKPVYIVVNKSDTPSKTNMFGEFYALGFDNVFPISSQTGTGTGDLLDEVCTHFTDDDTEDPYDGMPRLCIIGKPNVGKSTMLNAMLGKERSIVTDIAGTTRDAIDTVYNSFGMNFLLTDTAGIRKKSAAKDDIEFYSVLRSINAMERSDVSILILDASKGLESQDQSLMGLIHRYKKGLVVVINKWDLVEKETNSAKEIEEEIRRKCAPIDYFPIIFTSAINKQRIHKVLEKAMEVYNTKMTRIPTSKLNDIMQREIENNPPPALNGKFVKIKYITQLPIRNPTFAFFCNYPKYIKESYQRFLENKMRDHFGYEGVPITLIFKEK